jgi:hypothetical protein
VSILPGEEHRAGQAYMPANTCSWSLAKQKILQAIVALDFKIRSTIEYPVCGVKNVAYTIGLSIPIFAPRPTESCQATSHKEKNSLTETRQVSADICEPAAT